MLAARYHAFISYAHEDAAHAQWLLRAIESYVVPPSIQLPPDVPRRLRPLFLDRFELRADGPLDANLAEAMRRSDALLVICSPSAVASGRVDEEIRAFAALGRAARIFPVMVGGHPLAASRGYPAETECFPVALRELDANPMAADARPGRGSRRDARVRLVASLLGVRLDELQRREERRRTRRLVWVAAGSLTAAMIASALGAAAWFARLEADKQRQRSEHTARFLSGLLEGADPSRALGRELTARELVDEGAVLLQANELPADLRADMRVLLSGVYESLGARDKARGLLDRALVERAAISTEDASYSKALEMRAYLLLADGHVDKAIESQTTVVRIREQLGDRAGVAAARSLLGQMLTDAARFEEARAQMAFALREQLELYANGDRELVQTYNRIATLHQERGEMPAAIENFERALKAARQVHGPLHPGVATMLNNLALAHKYARNFAAADALYQESIAMRRTLYGAEHPAVAMALNNLAALRRDAGDGEGALLVIREALAMNRSLFGPRHPQVALNLYNLGLNYYRLKRYPEALQTFEESIDQRKEFFGERHPITGQAIGSSATALMAMGRHDEAYERLEQTVTNYARSYGPVAAKTTGMRAWFAEAALGAGRYARARDEFALAFKHCADANSTERIDCGSFALGVAEAELRLHDVTQARVWLDRAAPDVPKEAWRALLLEWLRAETNAAMTPSADLRRLAKQQLQRLQAAPNVPTHVVERAMRRAD